MKSPDENPTAHDSARQSPRIWVLLGHKAGDNNQVLALAEALGLPFESKLFRYRRTELLSNLILGPNLLGTVPGKSSDLGPPWPDLVITSGRRNEPIAHWIRRHGGPRVHLVHIGRPWSRPDRFDLVITTPQYELAAEGNIFRRELPLHRVDTGKVAAAVRDWQPRLAHLSPPYLTVLIGGQSGMFHLSDRKARRLARESSVLARSLGGSLLATSSARTPGSAIDAFAAALEVPNFVYRWHAGAADNPYLAMLGMADAFVVTSESMSMLAEACVMRKPVYMFDMADAASRNAPGIRAEDLATPAERLVNALRYRALTHRLAQAVAPRRMRRDVSRMHAALVASGRAVWLGEEFPDVPPPPFPDGSRAVQQVRRLLPASG